MDEAGAATVTPRRPPHRRYPWLVSGGLLLILVFLAINVLADGPMIAADRSIRAWVQIQANSHTWKWLKVGPWSPARVLVVLGNVRVAFPVLAIIVIMAAIRARSPRPLLTAAVGVALLLGTVLPAKILFARPDPGRSNLGGHILGAFPSGHTSTACVCYFLAVLLVSPHPPARARRIGLAIAGVLPFLVGMALIWCDLHWFTDVAAAWALSPLLIMLAVRLTRRRKPRTAASVPERRIETPAPPWAAARLR
ncbi:MAG TPA: phosphatase PAP2 family protein [Streptosporangiaceae bacterium]|jgi:undecaprenyl-diphosphatase